MTNHEVVRPNRVLNMSESVECRTFKHQLSFQIPTTRSNVSSGVVYASGDFLSRSTESDKLQPEVDAGNGYSTWLDPFSARRLFRRNGINIRIYRPP